MKSYTTTALSALLILTSVSTSLSQPCIPQVDSFSGPGFWPDTFPYAYVGQPYSVVFSFRLPTDTVVDIFGSPATVIIDSVVFLDISGLPQGFQWTFDRNPPVYYGGDTGCALISGTPQPDQVGTYWVELYGVGFGHIQGTGQSIPPVYDTSGQWLVVCNAPGDCPTITALPTTTSLSQPWITPLNNNTWLIHIPLQSIEAYDLSGKKLFHQTYPPAILQIPPHTSITLLRGIDLQGNTHTFRFIYTHPNP